MLSVEATELSRHSPVAPEMEVASPRLELHCMAPTRAAVQSSEMNSSFSVVEAVRIPLRYR